MSSGSGVLQGYVPQFTNVPSEVTVDASCYTFLSDLCPTMTKVVEHNFKEMCWGAEKDVKHTLWISIP